MGWRALSPDAVAKVLAKHLDGRPAITRVAIDGPPCADPTTWGDRLTTALHDAARPVVHVRADHFWRDRSVRLEYGHEDVESYLNWLDAPALKREVLDAAVSSHRYLPSLRDPATDRSTHAEPVALADTSVVVVSGSLLFGLGLPFEVTVHLATSAAARARRTPAEDAWTLPAYEDYERTIDPAALADVVVKVDDPAHPAVCGL